MGEKTRAFRTSREDEEQIKELLAKYPYLNISDILRGAMRFGLREAKTRPVEVLLGGDGAGT